MCKCNKIFDAFLFPEGRQKWLFPIFALISVLFISYAIQYKIDQSEEYRKTHIESER